MPIINLVDTNGVHYAHTFGPVIKNYVTKIKSARLNLREKQIKIIWQTNILFIVLRRV